MTISKALVTGGMKGIGFAVTQALLARGIEVVATTRHAATDLPATSAKVLTIDLTRPEAVDGLVSQFGDVDILINNAGHMNGCSLDQYDVARQQYIVDLNLAVPMKLMWRLGQRMADRKGGRIVNNTSVAAHTGHPDFWYGATKAGLLNATKSMSKAMGAQGIVCNAVAASPVHTDMLEVIPETRRAAMKANAILGRFAEPEEVAAAIVWLAVDAPSYINGICLDINNGTFMR